MRNKAVKWARIFVPLAVVMSLVMTTAPAQAKYNPKPGVTFNNPKGGSAKAYAIHRKLTKTIDATPKGENIWIFSWNILTSPGVNALLKAQRRGVRVRVLMFKGNIEKFDNTQFLRLKRKLRKRSKGRPAKRRSWARTCEGSCRGKSGTAHSKFFIFSKSGKRKRVVIQGSANYTIASANNQWNDIFTHTGRKAPYQFARKIFGQASKDKPVKGPFARRKFGKDELLMFPVGRKRNDPVMRLLKRVRCSGATNTRHGRTVIRIAPDVIRSNRGMRIARKLKSLWDNGCDIRIGYTVMGIAHGQVLRGSGGRGPVPMRHMVEDWNGDGEFDLYFHMKSMTIVGRMGKKRDSFVTLNGSANMSGLAAVSDENLGIYRRKNVTRRYQEHIDYWFNDFTFANQPLLFGTGRTLVDEFGRKHTFDRNPYARVMAEQ